MKGYLYSIKDAKTGYMAPCFDSNDSVAIRNFDAAVKHPESVLMQYPADFSLWRVAEIDLDTGKVEPSLELIVSADSLIYRKEHEGE